MTAPSATFPSGTPLSVPIYQVNPSTGAAATSNDSLLSELQIIAANQAGPYNVQFLSAQPVAPSFTEVALSQGSGDLLSSYDIGLFSSFSISIDTLASGATYHLKGSNDGTTWTNLVIDNVSNAGTTTASSVINAAGLYAGQRRSRYIQIHQDTYSSGTTVGKLELFTLPMSPQVVSQVNPGNTANTTPWLFTQANNNASVPSGAANTVIKNAAGQLSTLVVTTAGTGAGNVQIFDNATTNSGTVLFAFPATVSVAQAYQIYGWAKVGMTAQNVASGPVFTVYYS